MATATPRTTPISEVLASGTAIRDGCETQLTNARGSHPRKPRFYWPDQSGGDHLVTLNYTSIYSQKIATRDEVTFLSHIYNLSLPITSPRNSFLNSIATGGSLSGICTLGSQSGIGSPSYDLSLLPGPADRDSM